MHSLNNSLNIVEVIIFCDLKDFFLHNHVSYLCCRADIRTIAECICVYMHINVINDELGMVKG